MTDSKTILPRKSTYIGLLLVALGIFFGYTTSNESKLISLNINSFLSGSQCLPSCDELNDIGESSRRNSSFLVGFKLSTLGPNQKWAPYGTQFYSLEGSTSDSFILKIPIKSRNKIDFFSLKISAPPKTIEIRVIVDHSKWLRVYLNEKLYHATRYEEPIFFLPNISNKNSIYGDALVMIEHTKSENSLRKIYFLFLGAFTSFVLLFLQNIAQGKRHLGRNISLFNANIMLVIFLFSNCFHLFYWFTHKDEILSNVYGPSMTPFVPSAARFSDYFQMIIYSFSKQPYDLIPINYPPGSLPLFHIFSILDVSYSLFFFIGFSLFTIFFSLLHASQNLIVASLLTFSFPVLFAVDRGNIDLLCISLLLYGFIFFKDRPHVCAIFLGIIGAIKLWPLIFIFYFVKINRDFSRKLISIVTFVFLVLTLLGQYTYGGNLIDAVKALSGTTGLANFEFSTTIRGAISLLWTAISDRSLDSALSIFNSNLSNFMVLIILFFLCIVMFRSNDIFVVAFSISYFVIMLPSTTYIYRLGILLCNIAVALIESNQINPSISRRRILLLFSLTLPMHFKPLFGTNIGFETVLTPTLFTLFLFYFIKQSKYNYCLGTNKNVCGS